MDAQLAYVRQEMVAAQPPPPASAGLVGWMRERLFSGPFNSILTVISALVLALLIWPTLKFLVIDAVWTGSSRADCLAEAVGREVGACWPFVAAKFQQFMYGFYPDDQLWRVKLTYALGSSRWESTGWANAALGAAVFVDGSGTGTCFENINDTPDKTQCSVILTGPLAFNAKP